MSSGARRALAAGKQSSSWQLESSEAAEKAQRAVWSSQGGWSGALSAAVPGERILLLSVSQEAAADTGKSFAACPVLGSSFAAAVMQVVAQLLGPA